MQIPQNHINKAMTSIFTGFIFSGDIVEGLVYIKLGLFRYQAIKISKK